MNSKFQNTLSALGNRATTFLASIPPACLNTSLIASSFFALVAVVVVGGHLDAGECVRPPKELLSRTHNRMYRSEFAVDEHLHLYSSLLRLANDFLSLAW